jgi:hypothetical protein
MKRSKRRSLSPGASLGNWTLLGGLGEAGACSSRAARSLRTVLRSWRRVRPWCCQHYIQVGVSIYSHIALHELVPHVGVGQHLHDGREDCAGDNLLDEDIDGGAGAHVGGHDLGEDSRNNRAQMLLLDGLRVGVGQRGSRVQTAVLVLCGNGEVELLGLGDVARQLAPADKAVGVIRGAHVVGDEGDEARHNRLDHVDGQQAVADLAEGSAHRLVDLVDKRGALADAAVPALDKVAQDEAHQHVEAVGDDVRGGVQGLHHVHAALGEGLALGLPPLGRDEGGMSGAVDGGRLRRLRVPGMRCRQPCAQGEGRNDAGDKGVGQQQQLGLPVRQVAPCNEDGYGGGGKMAARHGHIRPGCTPSRILGRRGGGGWWLDRWRRRR